MVEHYIEIKEEITEENMERPLEIFRKYVTNQEEAEIVYEQQIINFTNKVTKSKYVEMNHDKDPVKNKPCISKEIKDGKVIN